MSTYLGAQPEHAGDKGRNPFQRRKSIDAVVVSPASQRKASGMQLIATTSVVDRDPSHVLSALLLSALTSVLFIAGAAPLSSAQSSSSPAGWTASTTSPIAIYKPDNLPVGKTFQLTIQSPQTLAGQPLIAWFTAQVKADLRERGAVAHIGNPQTNPDCTLLLPVPYRDGAGQNWTAVYAVAMRPDGAQICSMISNLAPPEMKTYIRSGATIFGETVKQARGGQSPSPLKDDSHSGGSAVVNSTNGNSVGAAQPGAGDGVPESAIAGILHEGRGTTTATGYQYVESADLVLSDGWEYSGLTGPPEDLNVEASKHAEPQKWHRWRRQGGAIYLQVGSSWSSLDGDLVRPLESGSVLNQNLVHRNATTFVGMGGTVGTDRINLYPNGRFERNANVLAGSGTVQASGGFSGGASSRTSRNGTTASAYGTSAGASGSVTARSSRSGAGGAGAAIGTYRITGYTLELNCANGQVQRLLAFHPFPGKPQVFIGNVTFSAE
jgi:hypothetical protein